MAAADLVIRVAAQTEQAVQQLSAVRQQISALSQTTQTITTGFSAALRSVARFAAGALGLYAVHSAATAAANALDSAAKTARAIGASVESIQIIRQAVSEAGGSAEDADHALRFLSRTLGDAARGNRSAALAFTALGLSVNQLRQLPLDEAFKRVLDALSQIPDPALRATLAFDVLGKNVGLLADLYSRGSASIDEMADSLRRTGAILSTEQVHAIETLNDTVGQLYLNIHAIAGALTAAAAPYIVGTLNAISSAFGFLGRAVASLGLSLTTVVRTLITIGAAILGYRAALLIATVAVQAYTAAKRAMIAAQIIAESLFSPASLIKMAVGALGAAVAIWGVNRALASFEEEMRRAVEEAQAQTRAVDDLDEAFHELGRGVVHVASTLAQLRQEWERVQFGEIHAQLLHLRRAGATEEELREVETLMRLIEGERALRELREEAARLTLGDEAYRREQLRLRITDEAQRMEMERLLTIIDEHKQKQRIQEETARRQAEMEREVARIHEEMEREAARIREEVMTPEERVEERIRRAQALLRAGLIDMKTYLRVLEKERAALIPPESMLGETRMRYAAAVVRGTSGAFSAVLSAISAAERGGEDQQRRIAENTRATVERLDRLIEEVRAQVRDVEL